MQNAAGAQVGDGGGAAAAAWRQILFVPDAWDDENVAIILL